MCNTTYKESDTEWLNQKSVYVIQSLAYTTVVRTRPSISFLVYELVIPDQVQPSFHYYVAAANSGSPVSFVNDQDPFWMAIFRSGSCWTLAKLSLIHFPPRGQQRKRRGVRNHSILFPI